MDFDDDGFKNETNGKIDGCELNGDKLENDDIFDKEYPDVKSMSDDELNKEL